MRAKNAFPIILDSIKLWWQDWANQVLVAFAAILLSLTVVLYPMAIFGVTEQALDLTHGIRTGIIGYWKGFKTYWRKSLPWGVLNLLVIALLGFNVWFYRNISSAIGLPLMVLMSALLVFWLIWQFYSVSCFFLQEEKTLKLAWKNGFAVMVSHPLYVTLISIPVLVLLFLSARYFIPLFFGAESLLALLGLMSIQRTLKA